MLFLGYIEKLLKVLIWNKNLKYIKIIIGLRVIYMLYIEMEFIVYCKK